MPSKLERALVAALSLGVALGAELTLARVSGAGASVPVSRLARGEGVSVAVVGTDEGLVRTVLGLAPGCHAFLVVPRVVPGEERPGRRRAAGKTDSSDAAFARSIDEGVERGAR